jgi:hypothetical protein
MKIAQIKYGQKKNLGDYQSRDLEIVGIVDENESDADAINGIAAMVDYYLNKPERLAEYNKQKGLLASEDEKVKTYAEKYVARFEAVKAEIEGV